MNPSVVFDKANATPEETAQRITELQAEIEVLTNKEAELIATHMAGISLEDALRDVRGGTRKNKKRSRRYKKRRGKKTRRHRSKRYRSKRYKH